MTLDPCDRCEELLQDFLDRTLTDAEWKEAEGWEPIFERLGLPVPDEPFPVTKSPNDFRAMLGLPPVEPG